MKHLPIRRARAALALALACSGQGLQAAEPSRAETWSDRWEIAASVADMGLNISDGGSALVQETINAQIKFFNGLATNASSNALLQRYAAVRQAEWESIKLKMNNRVIPGVSAAETSLTVLKPILEASFTTLKMYEDLDRLRADPAMASVVAQISDNALRTYFTDVARGVTAALAKQAVTKLVSDAFLKLAGKVVAKWAGRSLGVIGGVFLDPITLGPLIETPMPDPQKDPAGATSWLVAMSDARGPEEMACKGDARCLEGLLVGSTAVSNWQYFVLKFAWAQKMGSDYANRYAWVKKYELVYDSTGAIIGLQARVTPEIEAYLKLDSDYPLVNKPLSGILHIKGRVQVAYGQFCKGAASFRGSATKYPNSEKSWIIKPATDTQMVPASGETCRLDVVATGAFGNTAKRSMDFTVYADVPPAVTLLPLASSVWDGVKPLLIDANTVGPIASVTAQVLDQRGQVLITTPLTRAGTNIQKQVAWQKDMSAELGWKGLVDGSYGLRTMAVGTDKKELQSNAVQWVVKKAVVPAPVTVSLSSLQTTISQGGTLTLTANVAGRPGAQPTLVVTNPSTGASLAALFTTKVDVKPEYEQWQFQQAINSLQPGTYSFRAKVGAGPEVQSLPGVLVVTSPNPGPIPSPVSGTVDNAIRLSGKTGETLQLFGKVSGAEVVYIDFYTASSPSAVRDLATVNKAAGTWSKPRSFPVAGAFSYQVRAEHPTTKVLIDLGGRFAVEISDAAPPPPPPPPPPAAGSFSAAQPLTALQVGVPASFKLTGANLSPVAPPRVSLSGCDAPVLSIVSATQATYSCKPLVAGPVRLFWKVAGTNPADKENDLAQYTVTAASADGMRYVSDAPADDSLLDGGARITKSWTLANSGTTTWSTAYCLRPMSGAALATGAICPSGPVRPGESFVFSTAMLMPASQASQAMVKQNWAFTNPAGTQLGPVVWAQFQVKALPGRNEPPAAINCPVPGTGWTWANSSPLHGPGKGVGGADDSHALDYNRNAPSFDADAGQPVYAVADGAVYQGNGWAGNSVGQILINHTEPDGTQWSTGYLHMRSKTTAATVRRGDQIGVVANVGVPDGNNHLHFAVYRGHNGVTSVARTPTCNVAAGADGMQFVSDTPADNVLVDGGARITKSWTLANSGSTTWTTAYCLRPVSGTALGSGMVCPTAPVAPGQRYTFNTTLVMPAAAATQTQVKQTWALSNAAGAQVGPAVWAQLQVRAAGGGGAFAIVEPFAMPASVRANADTWVGVLNLSKAASEVRMSLVDAQGRSSSPAWVQAAPTRWTLQHSFAQAGTYRWTLDVRDATGASVQRAGNVQVSELPPVPLNPVLTKAESVRALVPWSASLKTAAPVYQANLVFSNGRRIPLYGDQTAWETRNENCVFSEAGTFPYELHLQRSQTDPRIEVFAGGTLQVLPAIVPANPPTITSPNTAIQGQPYSLMVTTLVAADRVSVRWPDSGAEQGLQSSNPARTQWVYTSRLFMQAGAVTFTVRTYKDGLSMPTGEAMGMLQVTMPNAAIKLVGTSNNIVKGERPYFTVAASLAVERVTVQLGNQAAVALSALGPNGAEQSHRGQVLAAQAGNVPYTITGFNAQGQPVGTPITGQVAVADPSDGLTVPNPVPAEVPRGQAVSWQFRTKAGPAEMWLAVAAPIGNLPLTGYYLNTTFSQPAGDYGYQLMRRDHLGNVFPIQGASGTLRLRDAGALPAITGLRTQPAAGKVGQSLSFVATVSSPASIARVELVFPDAGNLLEPMAQQSADTWVRTRTMAQAGNNRPALVRLVLKDGRTVQGNLSYTVQP